MNLPCIFFSRLHVKINNDQTVMLIIKKKMYSSYILRLTFSDSNDEARNVLILLTTFILFLSKKIFLGKGVLVNIGKYRSDIDSSLYIL